MSPGPHEVRGDGEDRPITLWATSIYGGKSRRGLVELSKQDEYGSERIAQMTPAEARAVALSLLEAAEAAETDAIVMVWLQTRIKTGLEEAVRVLRDFRMLRDQLNAEEHG
jgi:hypothetical protein